MQVINGFFIHRRDVHAPIWCSGDQAAPTGASSSAWSRSVCSFSGSYCSSRTWASCACPDLTRQPGYPIEKKDDRVFTWDDGTVGLRNAAGWHEVKVISQRLGHASIGFTLDAYAQVLPAADEQTANTLARHILGETAWWGLDCRFGLHGSGG
jgi:hypothetical protein